MRILLISHFFPPIHNAGTENYTLNLAKELQSRGHMVEVLCAEDWDFGENHWNGVTKDLYEGVLVQRVHLNWVKAENPNMSLYENLVAEEWLDNFLRINKFDLVHVTSVSSLGVGVFRSIKRFDIPLILTL